MVLHTFNILINHPILNTKKSEKFGKQLVPLGDSTGQLLAGGG